jgi:hypothetical protein
MRILTRPEIESIKDLHQIMTFHDRLVHSHLLAPLSVREDVALVFENHVKVTPLHNAGPCHWELHDANGEAFPFVSLKDLVGCPVTQLGYFFDQDLEHPAIPYLQFLNCIHVCCFSPTGGAELRHDRPREDAWDVFPQFQT